MTYDTLVLTLAYGMNNPFEKPDLCESVFFSGLFWLNKIEILCIII